MTRRVVGLVGPDFLFHAIDSNISVAGAPKDHPHAFLVLVRVRVLEKAHAHEDVYAHEHQLRECHVVGRAREFRSTLDRDRDRVERVAACRSDLFIPR